MSHEENNLINMLIKIQKPIEVSVSVKPKVR